MAIFQKPEQIHWTYVADLKIDLITSRRIDSRWVLLIMHQTWIVPKKWVPRYRASYPAVLLSHLSGPAEW